jgi:hypothetical protein
VIDEKESEVADLVSSSEPVVIVCTFNFFFWNLMNFLLGRCQGTFNFEVGTNSIV